VSHFDKGRWCLLPFLALLAAGCDPPGRPDPADRPVPANQVMEFGTLYGRNCAGCHGADGKLGPAPPLNDPIFLALVSDAELVRVITEGRAVTPTQRSLMPAFGLGKGAPLTDAQVKVWAELKKEMHTVPKQQAPLTTPQIKVLAAGIKKRWGPPASVPKDLMLAGAGGGNKDKGHEVFQRACADCHGSHGQGAKGNPPGGAINDPAFLALLSDQALRRYVITGRPDLGMPAYDGKDGRSPDFAPLTSAEIDDLVALLANWRLGESGNGN
jgi:mono/diheme cytochrome c family protein